MSEPPAESELVERMMGLVHSLADKVLTKPPEEREAEYAAIRQFGYSTGIGSEMTEEQAREAGDKMEELTRALVTMLLAGGPTDGTA